MSTTPVRRVTFNTNVQVREILSIYDYTPNEISATWHDNNETDKIAQRCFKILNKFEKGGPSSRKYCMRGLEGHTTMGLISKKRSRAATYAAAVLDEQERQYEHGESDTRLFPTLTDAQHQVAKCGLMLLVTVTNKQ